jgi:hypothetical protein
VGFLDRRAPPWDELRPDAGRPRHKQLRKDVRGRHSTLLSQGLFSRADSAETALHGAQRQASCRGTSSTGACSPGLASCCPRQQHWHAPLALLSMNSSPPDRQLRATAYNGSCVPPLFLLFSPSLPHSFNAVMLASRRRVAAMAWGRPQCRLLVARVSESRRRSARRAADPRSPFSVPYLSFPLSPFSILRLFYFVLLISSRHDSRRTKRREQKTMSPKKPAKVSTKRKTSGQKKSKSSNKTKKE